MKMRSFGRVVAGNPGKVVLTVLVLTIIFGYYAAQMNMTSDYHSFMPDDKLSRAYSEIQEDYAGVEMVQVIARGDNVLTKDSLLEQLKLEKKLMEDENISRNLQTPEKPENSVFSVADMVVMMDYGGRQFIDFANATINSVDGMEALNQSIGRMNSMISNYLYLYNSNASSDSINSSLTLAYETISMFLSSSGNMEFNITPPSFSISMSIDEKISYLENMSEEEIDNVLSYGIPMEISEFWDLIQNFQTAQNEIVDLSHRMSISALSLSQNIDSSLSTRPVYSNITINQTFSMAYPVFYAISQEFSAVNSQIGGMMSSMSSSSLMSGTEQMKTMISRDFDPTVPEGSAAMMIINLNGTQKAGESDDEFSQRMLDIHERIKQTTESFKGNNEYMVMSMRLLNEDMRGTMNETSQVLLPAAFALVIIILLIVFRSIIDTILGLLGLFMAIIWTYGFGVMTGMVFNQISTTVAVLIVGLGIDYAIHTVMRYREEIREGKDVKKAIISMETHLGMALILATVTTMVSFLSNISSPIPPLRDFGMMNAFGIFSAFIINLTFVPGAKVLLDRRRERMGKKVVKERGKTSESGVVILNKILALGATGAEHHPYKVIGVVAILSLASLYGAANLGTDFSETDFMPENSPMAETMTYIMDHFNSSGLEESYVLVKGDITSPDILTAIEETRNNIENDRYTSSSEADTGDISTLIKDVAQSNATFGAIVSSLDTDNDGLPNSNLTQVYDWLYEHDERTKYLLYRDADGRYLNTVIRVKSTSHSNSQHAVLYSDLKKDIKPLKDAGFEATITGGSLMIYTITTSLQNSQWNSLLITLIVSLIILSIVFYYLRKSLLLGAITTLPVVIALLWSMGIMYLIGMNFNMMTVTITALTIGLGITYSIHLTHRFLEELDRSSPEDAARTAVEYTGSSIFGAAATTMGGFGVLMLSSMPPLRQFGQIATMSILFSFLLSVFILPTFLVVWTKWKK